MKSSVAHTVRTARELAGLLRQHLPRNAWRIILDVVNHPVSHPDIKENFIVVCVLIMWINTLKHLRESTEHKRSYHPIGQA